uniref:Uncharacterized protein n=1 Tax=Arundo donax TaxID=35708 RepID=A0A0A9DG91_ARUDO
MLFSATSAPELLWCSTVLWIPSVSSGPLAKCSDNQLIGWLNALLLVMYAFSIDNLLRRRPSDCIG